MKKIIIIKLLLISLMTIKLFSQQFTFPIYVTDGTFNKYVFIGIHPDGTSGFDPGLDTLAPPPPPIGSFDTRLKYLNENYYSDIRDNTLAEKIFYLYYSPSTGGSIILYWDSSLVNQYGDFIINDNINGELFSLNMSMNDSLAISLFPVLQNSLRISVMPNGTAGIANNFNDLKVKKDFGLEQNFPNPFNPSTTIKYFVLDDQTVSLDIFNSVGKRVLNLDGGFKPSGIYDIKFLSDDLPSGVYYYRLLVNSATVTKKMILLK